MSAKHKGINTVFIHEKYLYAYIKPLEQQIADSHGRQQGAGADVGRQESSLCKNYHRKCFQN